MVRTYTNPGDLVHCHVGSLETYQKRAIDAAIVHCHVGSLETI